MDDVIVVGARCAGAPLAMLLARAGHRIRLVDRATFPSDTMSTHLLWQRGGARLQAWGLLDRLEARGCVPIRQVTFDVGSTQLTGSGPAVGGVSDAYCPRRTVLDALLVEAAVEHTANGFDLTLSSARLASLSERQEAFYRAAAGQPDTIRQIFGVLGGTVPIRDLYVGAAR